MDIQNLKLGLFDRLLYCMDENILLKIDELLENTEKNAPSTTVYVINDSQRKMLLQSEQDILNGDVLSNEQVILEEQQWLNE